MNKQNGIIAGVLAALGLIFGLISLGALDFHKGQGGTAWASLIFGLLSAAFVYVRAFDKTIKGIWIVCIVILTAIPLFTFWGH